MEENEYKDNEKVLHRTRCKLSLPHKETEEVECFVTEGHVVIEAEEPIKIPIAHIKHVKEYSAVCLIQSASYATLRQGGLKGTVILTFLDDLDKKQELSLEMAFMDTGYFKNAIDNQVAEQREPDFLERFLDKVEEPFRDKTRDRLCAELQSTGIDAQMAECGRAEELIECGFSSKSLGMVDITEGPIRWINVIKKAEGGGGNTYYMKYGVPDSRLRSDSPDVKIKSKRKGDKWQWKGKDSGLGIIWRLNGDILAFHPLVKMKSPEITIRAYSDHGCWVISRETPWALAKVHVSISEESWSCYQAIAKHLLAEWST